MNNYIIDRIPPNTPNNRRPGYAMDAETITIHNTANAASTARNERDWLTNPSNTRTASYHIVTDDTQTIECIPLNENAWHAGDGGSGPGNRRSIGIEICESGDYAKALDRAAELVAEMLKARNWTTTRLRRHHDWSGKNCPRKMNEDGEWGGWKTFVALVGEKLNPKKLTSFADVEADRWSVVDIAGAVARGEMVGFPDGTFKPGQPVTREELAVVLGRLKK